MIEAGLVATTLVLMARGLRFPLLCVPAAISGLISWEYLTIDILHVFDGSGEQPEESSALYFALLLLFLSCLVSYHQRANYGFWINKVGLATLAFGQLSLWRSSHEVSPLYLVISCGLLFTSVFFKYPSLAVSGLTGVFIYINTLFYGHGVLKFAIALLCQSAALWIAALLITAMARSPRWTTFLGKIERQRPSASIQSALQLWYWRDTKAAIHPISTDERLPGLL